MRPRPTNIARTRLPLALLLAMGIAALLMTGCGVSHKSRTAEKHHEVSTTTTRAVDSTSTNSAANLAVKHALEQSTPRPPDVGAQFEFIGGAGPGPCLTVHSPPAIHVYTEPFASFPANPNGAIETYRSGRVSFGQPVDLCIDGFSLGPAKVNLTGPKGFHQVGTLSSHTADECPSGDCDDGWDWVPAIDESWPVGPYQISARSAHSQASTSFRVVSSITPGIRVLGPSTDSGHNEAAPNAQVRVFLTGFRSAKSIRLVVYRLQGAAGKAGFFSAANVPLPSTGRAVVAVPTGNPAPNTTYLLTTKYEGVVYFAPVTIAQPYAGPALVVGPLPAG